MRPTNNLLRTPLIHFLGKRSHAPAVDRSPRVHPQSPAPSLPSSFVEYRRNATTHGPLGGKGVTIAAAPGEYFARSDLPKRFHYQPVSEAEIELINTGGAEIVF